MLPGPLGDAPRKGETARRMQADAPSGPVEGASAEQTARSKQLAASAAELKLLRDVQAAFAPLCFSLDKKIRELRAAQGGVDAEPYAPFDLRNALLMRRSPAFYDPNVSPLDVMPTSMSINDRRSFFDLVRMHRLSERFDAQALAQAHDITPVERVDTFYVTLNNPDFLTDMVGVPVGGYGEAFALDLMRAATILKRAANALIADEAMQVKADHAAVVSKTQPDQMRAIDPRLDQFNSPLSTVQEGIDSIVDAIVHLLGTKKRDGPDDPMAALRAVIANHIPEDLSLRIGFGVSAAMRQQNELFADAVAERGGASVLSAEFKGQLRAQREALMALHREQASSPDFTPGLVMGRGCPLGHPAEIPDSEKTEKKSGVQVLSETFLMIMEDLAARRAAGRLDEFPAPEYVSDDDVTRYSTIALDTPLDQLIAEVESFRYANDVLMAQAFLEHPTYRPQFGAVADSSDELTGISIVELEAQIINKAFACNTIERQLEQIIADNGEWRDRHLNALDAHTEGREVQQEWQTRESRRHNLVERLENARKDADALLRRHREVIEQFDSHG